MSGELLARRVWAGLLTLLMMTLGSPPVRAEVTPQPPAEEPSGKPAPVLETSPPGPAAGEPAPEPARSRAPGSAAGPAGAATPAPVPEKLPLTPEKINRIIEGGRILDENYRVSSAIHGDEVIVQTYRNSTSTNLEKDCKIDAVLIARKLMDADPSGIKRVRVRYFEPGDRTHTTYDEVVVVSGVVGSYAAGLLSTADLLTTLPMSHFAAGGRSAGAPADIVAVCPGPAQEDRRKMLNRINALKLKGVGTGKFIELFYQVEQLAGKGDEAGVEQALRNLWPPIAEQEKLSRRRLAVVHAPVAAQAPSTPAPAGGGAGKEPMTPELLRAQIEKEKHIYGDLYPEYGPMYPDRSRLSEMLMDMLHRRGQKIDGYMPAFKDIEQCAARGDLNRLSVLVHTFNARLGLKDLSVDDWYRSVQSNADTVREALKRK